MEKEEMIPKNYTLLLVWGKPLPDEVKRYIASWRRLARTMKLRRME